MSKTYSCAGVTLDYRSGIFIVETILKDGTKSLKDFENPILAVHHFTDQIDYIISKGVREYLINQGKNKWTGCDETKMTCHECKFTGNYTTKNCQLETGGCSDEQPM